jgi:hypothetical protein
MTLNEEVAWLKKELIHERALVRQARKVARDLGAVLDGVMADGLPEDLAEVFEKWALEERRAERKVPR